MIERWVEVKFAPRYLVSNFGEIYDRLKDRYVNQNPDRAGYMRVHLWVYGERKTCSVHRTVAVSFYDSDGIDLEVNHVDGDKTNNKLVNLEICDRSSNMIHAFEKGLATPVFNTKKIRIIETGEVFASTGQADRYLGVSSGSVSKTLRGLQPTCRGYTFEVV